MPDKYRLPLTLFAFEGYDLNDVAQVLGLTLGATKTRIFRAREKLRLAV
ncbi:MAG: hypothetical protein HOI95_12810 [Chromatiales bacterium]|jgi:DNA-directed RNA polymerase specialized sigma24 family protein|nr:hypothetical protein [Chromatiales bacterium]